MPEPLNVDALLAEMDAEINAEIMALKCPSVWALRMVFESDDGERIARIYPLTFCNEESATVMSDAFGSPAFIETNTLLFNELVKNGRWEFPIGKNWSAVFHTVVQLAVDTSDSEEG